MNDLPNRIISISRTFADGTPLFSKVHDTDIFPKELNSDLEKIWKCIFQWKIQFNSDSNKHKKMKLFSVESQAIALIPLLLSITMWQYPY